MNDLTRSNLDLEIERLHKQMAEMDPVSEDYGKMVKNVDILMKMANEDDKIHADATIEELKLDAEAERHEKNLKLQRFERGLQIGATVMTSLTTIAYAVILCISNKRIQERSILFEMDGYSHTDRSDKFLQKAPMPRI